MKKKFNQLTHRDHPELVEQDARHAEKVYVKNRERVERVRRMIEKNNESVIKTEDLVKRLRHGNGMKR